MNRALPQTPILMAEDDESDRLFFRKALEQNGVSNPLVTVEDGEELLDYLYHRGRFSGGASSAPVPASSF